MCVPMAQSKTSAATIDAVADEVELHRDLVPYLAESEVLGEVLKAPLVFMVPYLPVMAHLANEMYRTKTEGIHRAEAERNWHRIVWLHEKPYRLLAFLSIRDRLSDREYWEALGSIWIGTENLHDDQEQWLGALTAQRPGRARWLMDDADRATLAELERGGHDLPRLRATGQLPRAELVTEPIQSRVVRQPSRTHQPRPARLSGDHQGAEVAGARLHKRPWRERDHP